MIALLCSGVSLTLLVLIYYVLNRQISKQPTNIQLQDLNHQASCGCPSPALDQNGTLIAICDREQAEAALQQSERQFRAVFNGALDAMVITDDDAK